MSFLQNGYFCFSYQAYKGLKWNVAGHVTSSVAMPPFLKKRNTEKKLIQCQILFIYIYMIRFGSVLGRINDCRLFKAKSSLHMLNREDLVWSVFMTYESL